MRPGTGATSNSSPLDQSRMVALCGLVSPRRTMCLEYVRRRRDALHSQIHLCLTAMVRGVGEGAPEPLVAGHIARRIAGSGNAGTAGVALSWKSGWEWPIDAVSAIPQSKTAWERFMAYSASWEFRPGFGP